MELVIPRVARREAPYGLATSLVSLTLTYTAATVLNATEMAALQAHLERLTATYVVRLSTPCLTWEEGLDERCCVDDASAAGRRARQLPASTDTSVRDAINVALAACMGCGLAGRRHDGTCFSLDEAREQQAAIARVLPEVVAAAAVEAVSAPSLPLGLVAAGAAGGGVALTVVVILIIRRTHRRKAGGIRNTAVHRNIISFENPVRMGWLGIWPQSSQNHRMIRSVWGRTGRVVCCHVYACPCV